MEGGRALSWDLETGSRLSAAARSAWEGEFIIGPEEGVKLVSATRIHSGERVSRCVKLDAATPKRRGAHSFPHPFRGGRA